MRSLHNFKLILLMLFLVHGSACHSKVAHKAAAPAAAADPAIRPGTTVPLTIVGFNYTDRNINEFTVDGAGGAGKQNGLGRTQVHGDVRVIGGEGGGERVGIDVDRHVHRPHGPDERDRDRH